jgi:hypothetical protein
MPNRRTGIRDCGTPISQPPVCWNKERI